jgi:hypothetical protein
MGVVFMTRDEPPDFAPVPEPPKFQFSLLTLFWLVTVFAIFCSAFVTLGPILDLPLEILALLTFLFWPLPGLLLIRTCPANNYIRCIVFALPALVAMVCAIVAPLYSRSTPASYSDVLRALSGVPIILFMGLIFWSVQFYAIFRVLQHFHKRKK